MNHRTPSLRGRACWLLLGLAIGCARGAESGAPKSSGEPAAPGGALAASAEPEPEPTTLAEAEQLLARAQAELDQLALNQAEAPASGTPAPAPAAAAPEATPADRARRAEKSATADEAEARPAPPPSPCETACRAFASLGRASDAVCRLDSQGGQRCERARQIKDDAARRVAGCGCK